jgi:hypothetical protein
MARDPKDESLRRHKDWLGFIQPVGLVVSPPALVDADCHVNSDVADEYQRFVGATRQQLFVGRADSVSVLKDIKSLLVEVFGWQPGDLVAADEPRVSDLVVPLPEYGETLRPTYAVIDDPKASPAKWLMLIQELPLGTPFDAVVGDDNRKWRATAEARFERLLRETQVSVGLISNGTDIRLVYAPRGESPGHVTFPVPVMLETSGRPVFAALLMLLREFRVFGAPDGQRLSDILAASRKYQSTVSTELAKQVLAGLYDLVRGIQAADAHRNGDLLKEVLAKNPDEVYAGLLTVLLRLVFLLYAEDRGLMSESEVYVRNYSVTGLFEKLRGDAGRHPDTMDQRYGAWARLLTLFRVVHDGAKAGPLHVPARHGYLFDPDRYPFLEGRAFGSNRSPDQRIVPPLVSDGVVFRVLRNLLVLDGERLSYRALDVEQIGSVYEAMMGFSVEVATGRSIAVRPKKAHGAPVSVNLEELLGETGEKRSKWFKEHTELAVTPKEAAALKAAKTPEDAVAALDRKVEKDLTPNIVPATSMVLQPSEERRRSGSHYTPRSLTEPIVRKALEPVLKQLGDNPKPEQLLELKVCDPAMGSGAFLVEACRQLGEKLVKAWVTHRCLPQIPPDEDELLHAQRVVAQRCLYGVDKNPMAVDLAKLSLWLATLAKDHPFTFLDHALKCGDSLVGLTLNQIRMFHWNPPANGQMLIGQHELQRRVGEALDHRYAILEGGDYTPHALKEQKLKVADEALNLVRFAGNLAVAAFFAAENEKKREAKRADLFSALSAYLQKPIPQLRPNKDEAALREGPHPIEPFHWEIEFPEVFGRKEAGFDVIVGNPPFLGGWNVWATFGGGYRDILQAIHEGTGGKAVDVVAHFFRRAYSLIRPGGTIGLVATNTISQGDTREAGLRHICSKGGVIYSAVNRMAWPGIAAVVVSVVHVAKQQFTGECTLNGKPIPGLNSFLFPATGEYDPLPLLANAQRSYRGHMVYGMGFTFDDNAASGAASPISEMNRLIEKDARNSTRIFPFIGGEEINTSPTQTHHRYIISFADFTEAQAAEWPDLLDVVRQRVRPEREKLGGYGVADQRREKWWRFGSYAAALQSAIEKLSRCLVISQVSAHHSVVFQPSSRFFAHTVIAFPFESNSAFAVLQSRVHEIWARFFSSSMKDDIRYTPSDCFETFPFPEGFESNVALEAAGKAYYEFRADLMVRNDEGLTKTYNRFHDPNEKSADIFKLRELHAAMDRAVLDAYGGDLAKLTVPPCEFLLDYEDDEAEDEPTTGRQRKKPWRYRWPDAFRDEVLALLQELNKQRAAAEKKGTCALPKPTKGGGRKGKKAPADPNQTGLFG